jgi:RNA polymerase sigma-70 factor, ECF subfamily
MQTTLSDDELLRLMRAGDERAFLLLYQGRGGAIYRFALRMTGSEAIAEDVTQDVFMSLINDMARFDAARGSLTSYLFGIARNQVLRRIEKDRFITPIVDDQAEANLVSSSDPLSDLTRRETIEAVRQAVLALPVHYREVVVLCDLHEMSYAEAAEALGCALGTVRSRLHRARALLVEKLRPGRDAEQPTTQAGVVRIFV